MKRILPILISLLFSYNSFSVPAYPHPVEITQPDGSKITIVLKGDESLHWYESVDGYTLLKNDKGILEYATTKADNDLVPSGITAKDIALRTTSEKLFLAATPPKLTFSSSQVSVMRQIRSIQLSEQERAFPTTGSRNLVCILIGFKDKAFAKTQADFDNLFNQISTKYTTDGAYGSVKDYYLENSWNQFTITTTVAGPYTAANNMAYYGANDSYGNDVNPSALVTEAVTLANPDVNYANFDNDADGNVDGVYIIYAGYGEEAGGGDTTIWAHASSISSVTLDGKKISKYSCSAELRSSSGTGIARIGVICHEFGHVLGAPDYYDTNYATGGQYTGTGQWDMMANGSWNLGGARPAHHNGYTKWHYYGWMTPTLINSYQVVTMANIETNQVAYYYETSTPGEFFFLENRQQTGFDTSIPGHGMIIYHVSQSGIAGAGNQINATHPQYMYPVCASATTNPSSTPSDYGAINNAGCPFPGSSNKLEFSDESIPNSHSWAGSSTNKPISLITETSGVISFTFMDPLAPANFDATPISSSQIDLSWSLNAGNNPVLLVWSPTGTLGSPVNGTTYSAGNSIPGGGTVLYYGTSTGYSHTSLSPGTTYYYKAWSNVSGTYSSGIERNATTDCSFVSTFPYTENFTTAIQPNCWTQVDHAGNGQIWKFGTFTETEVSNASLTGNYAYLNSDNYGSGFTQNVDLITPLFDFKNQTNIILSFNHYYVHYAGSSATLSYSIDNGANWTQIQQWTATTTANPAVFSQDVTAQVAGSSQVLFKWNYTGTYAWYWAIDNVSIAAESTVGFNTLVAHVSLSNGQYDCWNALENVTVAGPTYSVVLQSGSEANFIAGESINFLPGFHAQQGSQMHGYITETGDYCNSIVASPIHTPLAEKSALINGETKPATLGFTEKQVKVYPNPNNGRFVVELTNFEGVSIITVNNPLGAVIHRSTSFGSNVSSVELSALHKGIYFVSIQNRNSLITRKIIIK